MAVKCGGGCCFFSKKEPSEQFGLAAGAFGTSVKLYYYYTRLTVLCLGLPGWAGTRKVKPIRILLKQETVSGSGISLPYASLHLASTPPLSFFTGRMPFLPPNQQCQSTEGIQ